MLKVTLSFLLLLVFSPIIYADDFIYNGYRFHIDNKLKDKHKELVDLVLTTASMDDEERQYWFDILPSMNKEQIKRLYDILDVERKKLEELEKKYSKKISELNKNHLAEWKEFNQKDTAKKMARKIQNKEVDPTGLLYISFNDKEIPRISLSPLEESKIISPYLPADNDKLSRYENMIVLEFGEQISRFPEQYKELYGEELFQGYLDKILNIAIELNDTKTTFLLYSKNLIDMESISISSYLAKKNFEALANQYELGLSGKAWKKGIFHKILNLTKWRNHENCRDACNKILKKFLNKMDMENWPFNLNEISNTFTGELVLLDVVIYLNKDLVNISLKNKVSDFIEKYKDNYDSYRKESRDWYVKLNAAYFSGGIEPLYNSILYDYKNSVDSNAIEGKLLESGTYFAFYLIKNNKNDEAIQLLGNLKGLGNSIYSSAYKYLEKDLIGYLEQVALTPSKYKKGNMTLGTYSVKGNIKKFKPFGKKYAIIIGVSDYKNLKKKASETATSLVDLKYADSDALKFEYFLRNPERSGGGWDIYSFIDNQANNLDVRKKIDSILTNAEKNDLIYIFFSGHARLNPNNNNEVYLLTYDFNPKDPYSGIPYDWLISTINRSQVKHLVAFIDACRSGTIKNSKGNMLVDQNLLNNALSHSKTKVVFTSGTGAQVSYEDEKLKQGIFTHYLLRGLNGESKDVNKDGFVNLNELEEYTAERVSNYTSNHADVTYQRPRVSNLEPIFSAQFPLSIR